MRHVHVACGCQALADNGPAAVYGKIQVNDCLLKCVRFRAFASCP